MKKKYRVTLPIEFDGGLKVPGTVVEMDLETALLYSHALIAIEEGESNANGNS